MAVIYDKKAKGRYPMAIVDGYLPSSRELMNVLNRFKQIGLQDPLDESNPTNSTVMFDDISGFINRYLENDNHQNIDHYFIHSRSPPLENSIETAKPKIILSPSIEYILHESQASNNSINIVVDSKANDWQRLKEYILYWTSVTHFNIKDESQYNDITKYRDLCDDVFNTIQELYDADPLKSLLSNIKGGKHHF